MTTTPKFPDIEVQLTGTNSNAFAILAAVSKALQREGLTQEANEFMEEATDGDYDHLLQTCVRWVQVT